MHEMCNFKKVQGIGCEAAGRCIIRLNYISAGHHLLQTQIDVSGGHLNNNKNA
jgi:hypothetical protein